MANILKDSAAPYILALLVSGTGWLVANAYGDLKSSHVVEYQIKYDREISGQQQARLTFLNLSQSAKPLSGTLYIRCADYGTDPNNPSGCIDTARSKQAAALNLAQVGADLQSEPNVTEMRVQVSFSSVVGSKVLYIAPIEDDRKVRFEIVAGDSEGAATSDATTGAKKADKGAKEIPLILAEPGDVRVLILRYFLWATVVALIVTGVGLLIALAAPLVAALAARFLSPKPEGAEGRPDGADGAKQTYTVHVEQADE